MANPLLKINQPADVKLGQKGSLNLGICWKADLAGRYTEAFERLQKEADGEFVRLVKPYIPLRTGALAGSTNDHTVLGSGRSCRPRPTPPPSTTGCPVAGACGRTDEAPTGANVVSMTTGRSSSPLSRPGRRRS